MAISPLVLMRKLLSNILVLLMLSTFLVSCGEGGGTPSYNPDIGPFDENGNYVEAWADNPPKSKRRRKLKNAEPKPKPKKPVESSWARKKREKKEREEKEQREIEERLASERRAAAAKIAQERRKSAQAQQARLDRQRALAKQRRDELARSRARLEARKTRPKPKPKPTVKPKPKPKPVKVAPRFRFHKVAKSDTLYGLAKRYGTSVTAIKKVNKLSGNTIRTGATLKIPR